MKKTILSFVLALATIMYIVTPVSALPKPKQRAKVTILSEDENFISTDESYYNKGETVTVYTHSNSEKYVTDIDAVIAWQYVKYDAYIEYTAKDMGDGTFTFVMPEWDVILFPYYETPGKNTEVDYKAPYEISSSITFGNAEVSIDPAREGEKVYMYTEPDEGIIVEDVTVRTEESDKKVSVKNSGDDYFFYMPAEGVIVTVNFEEGEGEDDLEDEDDASPEERYKITGSVVGDNVLDTVVSSKYAAKGETVYFSVSAEPGYVIGKVYVQTISNRQIDYEYDRILDQYSFVMPASDVNIICTPGNATDSYNMMLAYDETLGKVTLSSEEAVPGSMVYIEAVPNSGVVLSGISIKQNEDNSAVLVKEDNKGFYFVMPEADIYINVSFTQSKNNQPEPNQDNISKKTHICPAKAYFDVDTDAWYHEAVDYVILSGLMGGYSESTFAPEDTTTRAMIATILWRMEGSPAPATANPFADIAGGMWYTDAVIWASEKGIVNGVGNDMFDPDGKITREQLAAMVHRYAKYKGDTREPVGNILNYPDSIDVSDWAIDALIWCNNYGIVNIRDGNIAPKLPAQRAEAAFAVWSISD